MSSEYLHALIVAARRAHRRIWWSPRIRFRCTCGNDLPCPVLRAFESLPAVAAAAAQYAARLDAPPDGSPEQPPATSYDSDAPTQRDASQTRNTSQEQDRPEAGR